MMNLIVSWCGVLGMVVIPFGVGILFEQKLQPATRELGSKLLRRY